MLAVKCRISWRCRERKRRDGMEFYDDQKRFPREYQVLFLHSTHHSRVVIFQ